MQWSQLYLYRKILCQILKRPGRWCQWLYLNLIACANLTRANGLCWMFFNLKKLVLKWGNSWHLVNWPKQIQWSTKMVKTWQKQQARGQIQQDFSFAVTRWFSLKSLLQEAVSVQDLSLLVCSVPIMVAWTFNLFEECTDSIACPFVRLFNTACYTQRQFCQMTGTGQANSSCSVFSSLCLIKFGEQII
jgi:hypothetical protein